MMIQTAATTTVAMTNVDVNVEVKVVMAMGEVPHHNEVPIQCHIVLDDHHAVQRGLNICDLKVRHNVWGLALSVKLLWRWR